MGVPRTCLSRWEHGHELPHRNNRLKLLDLLGVPIGPAVDSPREAPSKQMGYQLALPFDEPVDLELKVTRKTQGSVQLELILKLPAS